MKQTKQEGVFCVYNEKNELIAIIKRDETTTKHLVYLVKEATSDDVAELINPNKTMQTNENNNLPSNLNNN